MWKPKGVSTRSLTCPTRRANAAALNAGSMASRPDSVSAASGSGGGDAQVPDLHLRETVIHVEDDGKSFDVAQGDTVTFKLARNAGTQFDDEVCRQLLWGAAGAVHHPHSGDAAPVRGRRQLGDVVGAVDRHVANPL